MTQIEIFKQKFEKMVDNIPASVDSGAGYVIDEVYKILDSLNNTELPEGLEEAAETIALPYEEINNTYEHSNIIEICKTLRLSSFKAGAKWRDAQIPKLPDNLEEAAEKYFYSQWSDGSLDIKDDVIEDFIAGAKWDRAKMMEKAVSGRYMKADGKVYVESWLLDIEPDSVKAGDEVRLIVIPKEK